MNKGFRIEKRRIGKAVVYMVLILLALLLYNLKTNASDGAWREKRS